MITGEDKDIPDDDDGRQDSCYTGRVDYHPR